MPAEVDKMLYTGEVPWHGVGTYVPNQISVREAINIAQLDWDVETAPIVTDDQKRTSVDKYRVTRRVDNNTILGIVRENYKPIQNRDAFQFFEKITDNRPLIETAGSLLGGSKVFASAKMLEPMQIGKGVGPVDVVDRYLLLNNPHDGAPLEVLFTPVRVVCANTLNIALHVEKSGDKVTKMAPRVRVGHSVNAEKQLKQAEKMMKRALQWYEKFGDFSNFLYKCQLNTSQVGNIIKTVFPPNKKMEVTPKIIGYRTEVERLFVEGKGHDKIAGSAWALFNAFTEYADHHLAIANPKRREPEDKAYSVWMGSAAFLKNKAGAVIAEAAL